MHSREKYVIGDDHHERWYNMNSGIIMAVHTKEKFAFCSDDFEFLFFFLIKEIATIIFVNSLDDSEISFVNISRAKKGNGDIHYYYGTEKKVFPSC